MLEQIWLIVVLLVAIALVGVGLLVGFLRGRGGRSGGRSQLPTPSRPDTTGYAGVPSSEGDSSGGGVGTDVLERPVDEAVETLPDLVEPETPAYERPESARGRLARLRARLARSNTAIGKGLLALLSRGGLDEAA